ncbi:long-chain fatty acid--CoA ligase [Actinoallomurus purpureus]|uniref:acyl-CoA synthetase n=1 Tax=Actinoallomurus purpureus TaxID=478114 RepID=UPI0020932D79|nr:long-chain fatty acid--CoA ligase [Actinoallomurus purpureus]MCO6010448.1 long-chain fatty acid--CoA ligase [Actinoallomurus purpureus]
MDAGIGSWVAGRAFRTPTATALVDGDTGRRRTYSDLHARTSALADALHRKGVRRGDRVGILALNSPEFIEVFLAAAKLGAITVPVNYRLSEGEVRYVLADAGVSALLHSDTFSAVAYGATKDLPVHTLIEIPSAAKRATGAPSPFETLVASGSPEPLERDVAEHDIAVIMYTSGTTGRPKGAMLTHGNLLWQAIHSVELGSGLSRHDRTVTAAPLFHIGGLGILTLPLLYLGGTSVILESFVPGQVVRTMASERATVMFLVAAMWTALAHSEEIDRADLGALRFAASGGSPTPLTTLEFFQQRGWNFTEGFGMTETSPTCSVLTVEHLARKAGSVGQPVTHLQWRLVDDNDRVVPVGEVGELVVRGPNVFAGYWGKPVETAEALRGGWFHTGDLGRADEDGFVSLVDRKKDMVITGGENVYPIEVEQVLYRHPDVDDVAVIGVPDERWGETVTAVVVRRTDSTLTAEELVGWVRERLAHFKCPRRVEFVDGLPRTATGKLLKRELRSIYTGTHEAVTR